MEVNIMAEEKKEEKPMMQSAAVSGLSQDSKVWGALCYVFPILMFIIVYVMEDKKKDKFVLFHAYQSLFAAIALWAIAMVVAVVTLGIGALCFPLAWLVFLYFAYQAYLGQKFLLPMIGEYAEKQVAK